MPSHVATFDRTRRTHTLGTTHCYTAVAMLLHRILAVLLIGMVGLGCYMMEIEDDPGSAWYFNLH